MAVGDVKSGLERVAAAAALDIRPPLGEEWVIHNIYHEYDADIAFTDGTNTITFDTDFGAGAWLKQAFHVTYHRWIRVINRDAAAARLIGYDGIQTK